MSIVVDPSRHLARQARSMVEAALVQAAIGGADTWWPLLRGILKLGDLEEDLNLLTWRALLLSEGDFARAGPLVLQRLSASERERWVDRYCGGFETFIVVEPPIDEMLDLLRTDDDQRLIEFCKRWLFLD